MLDLYKIEEASRTMVNTHMFGFLNMGLFSWSFADLVQDQDLLYLL